MSGSHTVWSTGTLSSWSVAALPIVNRFFERLRLEAILEAHLPPRDRRSKIPVARGIMVLLQNLLLAREPLYGLGEWAARHDPQWLGLTPEQIGSLNDDRIGRCLAALFHANRPALVLDLIRHAVREFDVRLDELHNDSTTVSFTGAYANAATETTKGERTTPAITWGHSKDHRPDLKQLLYILTVSSDGGVPVHCRVASGNITDDTTHNDNWNTLCEILGTRDFLYVADCKLVTRDNLHHIATRGGRFVSVLPRTRREDAAFRERLRLEDVRWRPLWDKHDDDGNLVDQFSVADGDETLADGYRLWWYFSTRKADLDLVSRSHRLQRAERAVRQLQAKLRSPRSRQHDRVAVETRIQDICKHYDVADLLRVEILERTAESFHQRGRGRPGANTEYVRRVRTRLDLNYRFDADALALARKTDGIFPLVTNDTALSALDALHAYKRQPTIERRFEQLKTDFAVAPVWLKDVKRIEGLLYVYFVVLLVEALLERELRRAMKESQVTALPLYPEGRPCTRPTARRILDLFEPIQRHTLQPAHGEPTTALTQLTKVQRTILRFLRIPTIYST